MIRLAIGSDHRGYLHKDALKRVRHVLEKKVEWLDVGTYSPERTDYPLYVAPALEAMQDGRVHGAVLLCGSGAGMAIAANRHSGIYAAVAWDPRVATAVKEDDNCNVLIIPADYVTEEQAHAIINAWLVAKFKHDEYEQRLQMIDGVRK